MSGRTGLRRKIWLAFILQAAAIGFAAVIGVYGASAVLKHVLIQRALQQEALHFWERRGRDAGAELPDTYNMTAYLLPDKAATATAPPALRPLAPGFHSLPLAQGGSLVLVEDRGRQRLYLLFKQEQVDSLAFWFGLVPLALVLVVVYIIAWGTYRASRRAVSPVVWLAEQVQQWDPHHPDVEAIRTENLPGDVEGETLALAAALHEFGSRLGTFVERERNFTRDASHELRTPLTVIRVAGDMMAADDTLSPMSRRALKRIQTSGRDMEALIDAFLILAREGDTGLPDEDFSVAEVVAEEVEKARELVQGKPIDVEVQVERDFELHAPLRVLSVMLGNLLRNACHYTDTGSVRVIVRAGRRIDIVDTGIGMSPEELARVFEPFFRGGNRSRDGQGIGLSIVRRLSERYGWPVSLDSEAGRGTTATIRFPENSSA